MGNQVVFPLGFAVLQVSGYHTGNRNANRKHWEREQQPQTLWAPGRVCSRGRNLAASLFALSLGRFERDWEPGLVIPEATPHVDHGKWTKKT